MSCAWNINKHSSRPTVQIQQLHCASPRQHELDHYIKKSCRCQNLPTLTARMSKLTLHEGNLAFSSKGFSSIIHPPRGRSPPIKSSKGSSKPVSSIQTIKNVTPEKNVNVSRSLTPPHQRYVSPTRSSYRSTSASRHSKGSSLLSNSHKKDRKTCASIITKKLANISISRRDVDYGSFSVQKEESPKLGCLTTTTNQRYGKYSKLLDTKVEINSENKSEVSKSKASSCSGIQRLHPGWRKVPWKPHFGWTDSYQELCKLLRQEITKGSVDSIYYRSEEEHAAAAVSWRSLHGDSSFLGGPSVSTVSEVLEVIRKMSVSRSPWLYTGKVGRWSRRTASELSEYDADDED